MLHGGLGLFARAARCRGGRRGPDSWKGFIGLAGRERERSQASPECLKLALLVLMAKARRWVPWHLFGNSGS